MHIGIIGLPASGKTTVFQTMTQSDGSGSRASGKADMRIVPVPDATGEQEKEHEGSGEPHAPATTGAA